MQAGVIRKMGARGYGFISPLDESTDVFFHVRDIGRSVYLQVGDKVEFELNQFAVRRGDRRACEVRVIP